jgi:bacterial/archaeal transporter family-2 protein
MLVGAQLALQAPINNALGRYTGRLLAVAISFAVGTTILACVAVLVGQAGDLGGVFSVPPYMVLGGLLGAVFVLTATIVVARIGAGAVAAATITGQLVASLAVDQAGVLGLSENPITVARVIGALALISGTVLVAYRRTEPNLDGLADRSGLWIVVISVGAMTAASALVAVQAPINAQLADRIGDVNASFASFAIGTMVLGLAVLLSGRAGGLRGLRQARWWQLTGGLMGAVNTTAALLLVQTVGAGVITAAIVSGQLVASVAIDRVALFGLRHTRLGAPRLMGVALLVAGVVLTAS